MFDRLARDDFVRKLLLIRETVEERGMTHEATRRGFLHTAGIAMAALSGPKTVSTANETPGQSTPQRIFDVREFGAQGDRKAVDTPAINKAIEAAANAGGGTVVFPAGTYLCYSIRLKSKVSVFLGPGSTVVAADPPAQSHGEGYDLAESNQPWEAYQDYGHNHWHNSLIWGENLEDVTIQGPGLIWGKGLSRGEGAGPVAEVPGVANKAIALKNCRNVLLRDFSILHGGHFGILATGVHNLTIDNLKIDTQRDGIDVDCCRNVRISNCTVNSPWDDAICLKSSYALGYAGDTEMVTITNCMVSGSYTEGAVLDASFKRFPPESDVDRNGRIKFGTESNGGFKNITISNCVFDGCFGVAILSVDGAQIEDVTLSNITMRGTVASPIFLRLGTRMRGPAGVPVGRIRRVNISNVVSSSGSSQICSMIAGVPGYLVEDVRISNILVEHPGGGTRKDAALQLPEKEKEYPEPTMFGTTPASAFFIRHARRIQISDFKILAQNKEERPCFILEDVEGAEFSNITFPEKQENPRFVLNNVKDFSIVRSRPVADVEIRETEHQEI
ncbi:MAG TPA: glycoside hydrolase family 28 protein [Candidatus Sulfotelmatobacter sp.]|nr:glycoside hydrolase family 28 protein [Candidatus Sulfotelmatobacter sp.]